MNIRYEKKKTEAKNIQVTRLKETGLKIQKP